MTRFYRAGKGGGTDPGRRRDGRESPTTRRAVVRRGASVPAHPDAEGLTNAKEPFDIDEAFRRLRIAVADLPKAAMFDLRDQGYSSPFEQLVGALISARTRDETTVKVCLRLFEVARTPQQMLELDEQRVDAPARRINVRRRQGAGHPRDRRVGSSRNGAARCPIAWRR